MIMSVNGIILCWTYHILNEDFIGFNVIMSGFNGIVLFSHMLVME